MDQCFKNCQLALCVHEAGIFEGAADRLCH